MCLATAQPVRRLHAGRPRAINNPCGGLGGRARSCAISVLDGVQNSSGNNWHRPVREEDAQTLTEHVPPGSLAGAGPRHPTGPAKREGAAGSVAVPWGTRQERGCEQSWGLAWGTLTSPLGSSEQPLENPAARFPLLCSSSPSSTPRPGAAASPARPRVGSPSPGSPRGPAWAGAPAPTCFWRKP